LNFIEVLIKMVLFGGIRQTDPSSRKRGLILRFYINHWGRMAIRFLWADTRSAPTYYTLLFSFRADVQVISNVGIGIYVKFNLTGC
jgi:hypothetical protein